MVCGSLICKPNQVLAGCRRTQDDTVRYVVVRLATCCLDDLDRHETVSVRQ